MNRSIDELLREKLAGSEYKIPESFERKLNETIKELEDRKAAGSPKHVSWLAANKAAGVAILVLVLSVVFISSYAALNLFQEGMNTAPEEVEENENNDNHDVPTSDEVNVSVLTDPTVGHSLSSGLGANDCSTYEKMEKQSELVVYGEKVREFFRQSEVDEERYELMAEIEIETVIKLIDNSYESGDRLLVCEDINYYPGYNLISHLNGYRQMENGKKYYLMLAKEYQEKENSAYYIIGGVCGRIPEDEGEEITFETEEDKLLPEEKQKEEEWVARNRKKLMRKIAS